MKVAKLIAFETNKDQLPIANCHLLSIDLIERKQYQKDIQSYTHTNNEYETFKFQFLFFFFSLSLHFGYPVFDCFRFCANWICHWDAKEPVTFIDDNKSSRSFCAAKHWIGWYRSYQMKLKRKLLKWTQSYHAYGIACVHYVFELYRARMLNSC